MILVIITDAWHPQVNGVVRTYEYLIAELERDGHEVHVISPADFARRIPMPSYAEIELVAFSYKGLKEKIDTMRPDFIHISTEGPLGWAGRKYCLRHNSSFTTSYHTHFPDYAAKRFARFLPFLYRPIHGLTKGLIRRFHDPAKAIMVATQSLEDDLAAWGFRPPMHRLTRGVDFELFSPGEKTLFQDLPQPVALYVGRVAIEKNIEDFLSMEWKGSKVVIGNGPSLDDLKARYPAVHFAGTVTGEALAAHYRSADVFVFPSRTDTFGMVLIEALACGLPIAAYDVTGPKDIVTEEYLGVLCNDDLGKAAREALNAGSSEKRAQHVREHYSWQKAGEQFLNGIRTYY